MAEDEVVGEIETDKVCTLIYSSPIDELWRWCPEGWWGPDAFVGKAERYPWQPSEREPPLTAYLIHNFPRPKHAKGIGGVGVKFHNASPSELCHNLLQSATEALAWSLNDS